MRLVFVILFFISFLFNSSSSIAQNSIPEVEFKVLLSQSGVYLLKGDYDEAISCLNRCVSINPKSSVANFQLAKIYIDRRDFDAGLNYGLKAYNLNPNNKYYSYLLGVVYEALGKKDLSLKFYKSSLSDNPSYEELCNYYLICEGLKNYDEQISTLNRLIELDGYSADLGELLAETYLAKNDWKNAEVQYIKLSRIDSTDLKYLNLLLSFYVQYRKPAEAQKVQKRIEAIRPQNISGLFVDNFIYRNSGRFDLLYQNLIESSRNDKSVSSTRKVDFINDFVMNSNSVNYDSISLAFDVLCETYPKDEFVFASYSSLCMLYDEPEKSAQILENFLDTDKSNFVNWKKLFLIYSITENYQELDNITTEAMEYFPDLSEVYLFKAVANTYLGDKNDAEENFQIAKDLGIEFSQSRERYDFYLGVYNYFTGNQSKAMQFFDKFLQYEIDDYYLHLQCAYFIIDYGKNFTLAQSIIKQYANDYNLNYYFYFVRAFYNFKKGDLSLSREDILKAIKLDSSKYYVYNMAGDIFSKSGDCTNAVIYWNQAIDRGGNSTLISKKIQNCK